VRPGTSIYSPRVGVFVVAIALAGRHAIAVLVEALVHGRQSLGSRDLQEEEGDSV
jgi:hypothetical protein